MSPSVTAVLVYFTTENVRLSYPVFLETVGLSYVPAETVGLSYVPAETVGLSCVPAETVGLKLCVFLFAGLN
jgi:hypothetical protein